MRKHNARGGRRVDREPVTPGVDQAEPDQPLIIRQIHLIVNDLRYYQAKLPVYNIEYLV